MDEVSCDNQRVDKLTLGNEAPPWHRKSDVGKGGQGDGRLFWVTTVVFETSIEWMIYLIVIQIFS